MDISNLSFDNTINYLIDEEYLYTNPVISKNTFKLLVILNDNSLAELYNQYDVIIEEKPNDDEKINSLINNVIAYIQYGYVAMSLYDNNNKNITNNYFNNYNNFVNTIVPSGNKKTNYWYKKQGIINYCSICDSNNIFQKCDQCYSKYCKSCINNSKSIKCYCGCGLIIYCDNCKYNGINNIKKCFCNKYYFSKHYCKICKM